MSFTWKDYREGNQERLMKLDADEFIRRFLLHALPDGFMRIRHYGLLSNCHREEKLELCRKLLERDEQVEHIEAVDSVSADELVDASNDLCPACKQGRLRFVEWVQPLPEGCLPSDTS